MSYEDIMSAATGDADGFCAVAADELTWTRRWDGALDDRGHPPGGWFPGDPADTRHGSVDRNTDVGRGDVPAPTWHSAMTGACQIYTDAALPKVVNGETSETPVTIDYAAILDETVRTLGAAG